MDTPGRTGSVSTWPFLSLATNGQVGVAALGQRAFRAQGPAQMGDSTKFLKQLKERWRLSWPNARPPTRKQIEDPFIASPLNISSFKASTVLGTKDTQNEVQPRIQLFMASAWCLVVFAQLESSWESF